ncbi:FAD-binding protein (plasmid) [Cetobacterium somerae]|uniref:FAD-binding protein n=1 Tax=Cetobacterium somerae TaxID=188913 RepID=UPI001F060DEA|nr:FAD-binding protein [Cetobacterium somerae]UPO98529.1 FAD-binding protein [Cetobacterium somerae]
MKILENEELRNYTTIKIGGRAEKMYFPQSPKEFSDLLENYGKEESLYIISGGSNLLINDLKVFKKVISLKEMNCEISQIKDGKFYIGASVPLQKLINFINDKSYGGIEYLYSLPALVGGAVAMNAGRGKIHKLSISDYIEELHVYDFEEKKNKILNKSECDFSYRHSVCKEKKIFVIGVIFNFEKMEKIESDKRKKTRMELVRRLQDNSGYNFGSVFRQNNKYLMQIIKFIGLGNSKGVHFSKKTSNWIINNGNGSFKEAYNLIEKIKKIHKFLGFNAITEVILWK